MATHHSPIESIRVSIQETTPTRLKMTSASANGDCNGCIVRLGGAEKLLKEAIMFTLKKSEFLAATPRATSVQSVGKTLLSLSSTNEKIFKKFSQDLVKLLSKSFQSISKCRSNSAKRDVYGRHFINSLSKNFLVFGVICW